MSAQVQQRGRSNGTEHACAIRGTPIHPLDCRPHTRPPQFGHVANRTRSSALSMQEQTAHDEKTRDPNSGRSCTVLKSHTRMSPPDLRHRRRLPSRVQESRPRSPRPAPRPFAVASRSPPLRSARRTPSVSPGRTPFAPAARGSRPAAPLGPIRSRPVRPPRSPPPQPSAYPVAPRSPPPHGSRPAAVLVRRALVPMPVSPLRPSALSGRVVDRGRRLSRPPHAHRARSHHRPPRSADPSPAASHRPSRPRTTRPRTVTARIAPAPRPSHLAPTRPARTSAAHEPRRTRRGAVMHVVPSPPSTRPKERRRGVPGFHPQIGSSAADASRPQRVQVRSEVSGGPGAQ